VKLKRPIGPDDHLRGELSAPISLVEFGDYECPYCGAAFPIVEDVRAAFGERLVFVFRNFPIVGSHPHALVAAQAAEAAAAQGRFWEMHDMLYRHQHALGASAIARYADVLGLDRDRFDVDLHSREVVARIRADLHDGAVSGVNGTPTFFVNGWRYDGAWDRESLYRAIAGGAGASV
jgi:protein-disulfide isomerase